MKKRNLDGLSRDLQEYRRNHNYNKGDVAKLTGLSLNTMYNIETLTTRAPAVLTIEAFAKLFNMTSTEFFDKYVAYHDVPDIEEGTKKDQ